MPATRIPEARTWEGLHDKFFGSSVADSVTDGIHVGLRRAPQGVWERLCSSFIPRVPREHTWHALTRAASPGPWFQAVPAGALSPLEETRQAGV